MSLSNLKLHLVSFDLIETPFSIFFLAAWRTFQEIMSESKTLQISHAHFSSEITKLNDDAIKFKTQVAFTSRRCEELEIQLATSEENCKTLAYDKAMTANNLERHIGETQQFRASLQNSQEATLGDWKNRMREQEKVLLDYKRESDSKNVQISGLESRIRGLMVTESSNQATMENKNNFQNQLTVKIRQLEEMVESLQKQNEEMRNWATGAGPVKRGPSTSTPGSSPGRPGSSAPPFRSTFADFDKFQPQGQQQQQ